LKSVELQPQAEAEADAAATWYESEHPGLALQFLLELDAAIERAAENPLAYERVFLDARRLLMRRFPYAIYFTCERDVVRVFAILHQHRQTRTWQSRLR
jgi:plasmid stabilization system protein ParE